MSTTTTYTVTGMTCDHCVAAVTQEVRGVTAVDVHLVAGGESTVAVSSASPVAERDVRDAVDEAGDDLTRVIG